MARERNTCSSAPTANSTEAKDQLSNSDVVRLAGTEAPSVA